MDRVYNFSAGPSMLPLAVLEKAQKEFVCYGDSGMSVMEMSHRSKDFEAIIQKAEQDLRDLMHIPDAYKVLFLQGGGSLQFAMVPLNLMQGSHKADYIITGQWAKKAFEEGQRFGNARVIASSADQTFTYIPRVTKDMVDPEADYLYLTYNNTIYGTHYTPESLPENNGVTMVTDISSNILGEEIDVTKFGLLFAGAQKNIGPAGVTVVIVREDLLGKAAEYTPTMLKYDIHAKNGSLYNTPPTYGIYMAGLTFQWVKDQGGVAALQAKNEAKAKLLYDFLDHSQLFKGTVAKADRSIMNIPFVTGNADMDDKFVKAAKAAGFVNLKGHRTVGGMRASIYNAMPLEGVEALVDFMAKFEAENK